MTLFAGLRLKIRWKIDLVENSAAVCGLPEISSKYMSIPFNRMGASS